MNGIVIAISVMVLIEMVAVVVISLLSYKERKDLYDRIMCRNAEEYQRITSEPKPRIEPKFRQNLKEWRKHGDQRQD